MCFFFNFVEFFSVFLFYRFSAMSNRNLISCPGSSEDTSSAKRVCKRLSKTFQQAWFDEFPSWRKWVVRLEDGTK